MTKQTSRWQKQVFLKGFVLCISLGVACIIGEAFLRFTFPNPTHYNFWTPHLKNIFRPNPEAMPGISDPSALVINSQGIRGDEFAPEDTYRILAIGGSTTECLFLDQAETWTALVQKTLNEETRGHHVWVGNAGLSGRNTRHHLVAMTHYPFKDMEIDAVVFLVGANDLLSRLARNKYDPTAWHTPHAKRTLLSETFSGSYIINPKESFFRKTAIWQFMRKGKWALSARVGKKHVQDDAGKGYVTSRQLRKNSISRRNEMPDLSSALKEYALNIHGAIDRAEQNSIRLIFMTQPCLWQANLSSHLDALLWLGQGPFQTDGSRTYYSPKALEQGMEAYNASLRQVCAERQIECIDLASQLEKDTAVFFDDLHFNESGARKVSHRLSHHMLTRPPFCSPLID